MCSENVNPLFIPAVQQNNTFNKLNMAIEQVQMTKTENNTQ